MRQSGFSLIEMMIALVLGMIVVSAALVTFSGTLGANSAQMKYSRLNNDLRSAMMAITRDLRRAGYNPSMANETNTLVPTVSGGGSVIDMSYFLDASNLKNYQYQVSSGAVQVRERTSTDSGATWSAWGSWSNVTDPAVTNITGPTGSVPFISSSAPVAGDNCVTITDYEIALTGTLLNDTTGASRSIRETIRPRNVLVAADSTCLTP